MNCIFAWCLYKKAFFSDVLRFDNYSSWIHSKLLSYVVDVVEPEMKNWRQEYSPVTYKSHDDLIQ